MVYFFDTPKKLGSISSPKKTLNNHFVFIAHLFNPTNSQGRLVGIRDRNYLLCQVKVSPLAEWQLPSLKLTYIAPEIGRASSWLPRHQQKKCHCRACSWQLQAFVQLLVKRKCRSKPLLEPALSQPVFRHGQNTFRYGRWWVPHLTSAASFRAMCWSGHLGTTDLLRRWSSLEFLKNNQQDLFAQTATILAGWGFRPLTLLPPRRYVNLLRLRRHCWWPPTLYTPTFKGIQPSPTIKDHVDLLGRPWKLVKG